MSRYRPGQAESELTQADIVVGGVKSGDVVLVDSAMRTMGPVHRTPSTVVNALLEVVSDRGTLVIPTFTLTHEAEEAPIITPYNDPSEMGVTTRNLGTHDGNWAKKTTQKCPHILVTPNQRD